MTPFRLGILAFALLLASAAPAAPAGAQAAPAVKAVRERAVNPKGPFARVSTAQRDSIIENARLQLGTRYRWAGANPEKGLDCSGFIQFVFGKLGVDLPHSSSALARLGGAVTKDTAEMRPGDLLVFGKGKGISHVGMYLGDGRMLHASSSSGAVVETAVVRARPLRGLQWKGVRRVIAVDSLAESGTEAATN